MPMHLLPLQRRLLLAIGLFTWLIASVPTLWDVCNRPPRTSTFRFGFWLLSFVVFGICFWLTFVGTSSPKGKPARSRALHLRLIAIQTVTALLMVYLVPCYSIGVILVLVAWQLALLLPLPIALVWMFIQTALLAAFLYTRSSGLALFATSISVAFQLFALITASVAKSESRARSELERANAELRATRELLAESSRIGERSRISGELHDVLGHNLTALNIHLEVAKHLTDGKALEHVEKSQALAKILLRDVRDVVTSFSSNNSLDLRGAVETLLEGLPYPEVHLSLPANLKIEDSVRAHALLRCVQEIVTNALRHSGAENLWLEVYERSGGVEVHGRDDGHGAKAVQVGNGIRGMRQRLESIGGHLRIESNSESGFSVNAWLPSNGAVS
jgi:signal transduction histidine kinase